MEVAEVKFGFIPNQDASAYRVRRRYRLVKGGHPQLVLIHYTRGQSIRECLLCSAQSHFHNVDYVAIIPSLNHPTRAYPLRAPNEPPVYVIGEKAGQKVFPGGPGGPSGPHLERQVSIPPGMAMNLHMNMGGNPAALLAQQNSTLEAMERRNARTSALHAVSGIYICVVAEEVEFIYIVS